jgi:hypothetical protein
MVFEIEERIQVIDWTGVFWKKEKKTAVMSREEFLVAIKNKK